MKRKTRNMKNQKENARFALLFFLSVPYLISLAAVVILALPLFVDAKPTFETPPSINRPAPGVYGPDQVTLGGDVNRPGGFNATYLLNAISANIINPMIFALFAVAFAVFIWGLVQFLGSLDNEEARSTGVKHMIWGIIGMVIMISVNGIIALINNTIRSIGGG